MSIRNIDTQIMIQRTTDVAREANNLIRHPAAAQEHLAAHGKAESALAQSRVQATTESEMDNIDADGSGSGAAGGEGSGKGSGEEETQNNQNDDFLVPPSNEIKFIDMIV